MRRRGILLGGVAALVATSDAAPERALRALFRDHAGGIALGRAYLAGLPSPVSAAALAGPVWAELSGHGGLRAQVAALIREDFAAGRVECLDGWIVSSTEARICGIAALG